MHCIAYASVGRRANGVLLLLCLISYRNVLGSVVNRAGDVFTCSETSDSNAQCQSWTGQSTEGRTGPNERLTDCIIYAHNT